MVTANCFQVRRADNTTKRLSNPLTSDPVQYNRCLPCYAVAITLAKKDGKVFLETLSGGNEFSHRPTWMCGCVRQLEASLCAVNFFNK